MEMHRHPVGQPLPPHRIKSIFQHTLSLGVDMDNRGLHWTLPRDISPEQRLAFALAVYFSGGLYIFIDADRGFLCVERIAHKFFRLQKARSQESYRIGHAFAELHDALGYTLDETIGFGLIADADLACPEGYIKGFSDSMNQSLEGDVMRAIKNDLATSRAMQINNLRHYVSDHVSVSAIARNIA